LFAANEKKNERVGFLIRDLFRGEKGMDEKANSCQTIGVRVKSLCCEEFDHQI